MNKNTPAPHNPESLPPEVVDPEGKGYRLLDGDEVCEGFGEEPMIPQVEIERWVSARWWRGSYGNGLDSTYRTLLSREQLAALRIKALQARIAALETERAALLARVAELEERAADQKSEEARSSTTDNQP